MQVPALPITPNGSSEPATGSGRSVPIMSKGFSKYWFVIMVLVLLIPQSRAWSAVCSAGDEASCSMSNGCPGTMTCFGTGYWGKCMPAAGIGTGTCAGCGGATGKVVCSDSGKVLACKISETELCNNCDDNGDGLVDNAPGQGARTLTRSCNRTDTPCPIGGTQTCTTGAWSPCSGCGGQVACNNCNKSGLRTCDTSCNLGGCVVGAEECNACDDDGDGIADNVPGTTQALSRPCQTVAACSVGGSQICNAASGFWGPCWGCSGVGTCTGCGGKPGTAQCNYFCNADGAACNVGLETCNGCDDDGDGIIDNAGNSTQPRSLTQSCMITNGECSVPGTNYCMSGYYGACTSNVAEQCNGVDDNCDGNIDELVCRTQAGGTGTCVRTTCEVQGAACGSISDGCGGSLNCGGCEAGKICQANACVPMP